MRIIATNYADTATMTATPTMVESLPVENLQNQYREKVARTTSTATQLFELSWPSPRTFSSCVIYRSNFSATAQWRVQIFVDATMVETLYDSDFVYASRPKSLGELYWGIDPLGASYYDDWGYTISPLWFAPVIGTYMRIRVEDFDNQDGYLEASRLFVGPYIETTYAPDMGAAMQWIETSRQTRTEGGTLRTEPGINFRALQLTLSKMPENDRIRLSDIDRIVGLRGDLYVSVFPGLNNSLERDYQMQAKLVALNPIVMNQFGQIDKQLDLEEI